jgi:hypothetical protein
MGTQEGAAAGAAWEVKQQRERRAAAAAAGVAAAAAGGIAAAAAAAAVAAGCRGCLQRCPAKRIVRPPGALMGCWQADAGVPEGC